jgi:hypothetical protein
MALYPVAGCRFFIGGILNDKATDFIASDFNGQTWTEVDGWMNMGGIGDAAQIITTPLINRGRDQKQKGTSNAGSMQNQFAVVPLDAGQALLIAAGAPTNKNNYAFRIDMNDAVAGAPSKRYFIGVVATGEESGGGANTIQVLAATVEVNSNIVRVAAT